MELGFSINNAGPLTQISVPVLSIELAVQLATGAYGWWKARDRGHAILGLVGSKQCQLSTTSTFNLLRYVDKRKDSLVRGVARNPDGILSCVTMPNASSASSGDQGLVCLRAVVCALLCFYSTSTVVDILVGALPGTLYTSEQEGGNETIEGALLSSLRQYVKAAASEEDSDGLRQKLIDAVDSKLGNITGATSKDVFECDNFLEFDIPNFIGVLRWILTPTFKRDQRVYPTRSLKVWALAAIMAQLGFEVAASMHAVSTKSDYYSYIEDVGYQPTYQEVVLVTTNVGPTDPLNVPGSYTPLVPNSKPRIGSIRSIPWIAFRHLHGNAGLATPKYLSEVWEFTFEYVFHLLEPAQPRKAPGDNLHVILQFTQVALESFGKGLHPKLAHIDKKSKFWNDFQWLSYVAFHPLQRFATPKGKASLWNEGDILSQFKGETSEYASLPDMEILDDWYITRAVVLATIYAVCCKWLYIEDGSSNPLLDTEVAFCPDYIRRGNLSPWTSLGPFSKVLLPEHRPAPGFWAEINHSSWFQMLVRVFSGTPVDHALEARAKRNPDHSRDMTFKSTLGFQRNGIVFLPNLLVYPSGNSEDWFKYHIRVGQLLDMPLSEDGFVCGANGPPRISKPEIWKPGSCQVHMIAENLPSDTRVRIDTEPWWESDERTVIFRARVNGSVRAVFSPAALFQQSHLAQKSDCKCQTPKTSVQLKRAACVLTVSEFLDCAPKNIKTYNGSHNLPIIVQTGGDPMAQVLCLGVADLGSSVSIVGCMDSIEGPLAIPDLIFL